MYSLMVLVGSFFSLWAVAAWFACAFFAGHVAAEKNRCGFCWFLWGLMFGPISLIAAVGLPMGKADSRKAADRRGAFSSAYQPLPVDILDHQAATPEQIGYSVAKMVKEPSIWILAVIAGAAIFFAYSRGFG